MKIGDGDGATRNGRRQLRRHLLKTAELDAVDGGVDRGVDARDHRRDLHVPRTDDRVTVEVEPALPGHSLAHRLAALVLIPFPCNVCRRRAVLSWCQFRLELG